VPGAHGVPERFIRKILVGADGSDGSSAAIAWSARLAAAMPGAEVVAVHVLTYNEEFARDLFLDTIRTWRREVVHDLETTWTEPLRAAGVAHRCVLIEESSAAGGLLKVAAREHVDLLVIGARGREAIAGRLLGGTSYKLVHHTERPVVVVPLEHTKG
jgi:nucleotide-binding universal stress UspA family protein